jgi:putative heme-binding domain-containing protein
MKAWAAVVLALCAAAFAPPQDEALTLTLRRRVESPKGAGRWCIESRADRWDPKKTALIICDMWDKHWCAGATRRVGQMAPRLNETAAALRRRGVLIIHCPSDTMSFYGDTPQRRTARDAPKSQPPVPLERWRKLDPAREGPLPIDDADGGCDDEPACRNFKAWNRQIDTIAIEPGDAITDSDEAYHLMRARGIDRVLVAGVHTNMCVLGRPFSIRQLVAEGMTVALIRDLTDTMYNPRRAPFVNHFTGTDLVVEHIERYWCPTTTSADLAGGAPFRSPDDRRPHLVVAMAEDEYKTAETLPAFALRELGRDFRVTLVHAPQENPNSLPGIVEALADADLLLLSVRRRALPEAQLQSIRDFVAAGKPIVGIRTASHAFALRQGAVPDGAAVWPEFDRDVLGGNYHNHHGADVPAFARVEPSANVPGREDSILIGVPKSEFKVASSLYMNEPVSKNAKVLLRGRAGDRQPHEPVAWTHASPAGGRVFYTSLGAPGDFEIPAFRRLLLNGIFWAAGLPIPQLDDATQSRGGLSPAESMKLFTVAPDLELEQVLAEPIVAQPRHLSFDERGRLWVVQYLQYPYPAGLKVVSRDTYWRVVYDKVPPPPPRHFPGRDKITIHEDTDGDGTFDKHRTFVEGLSIVTSCARGRDGVWVLNPPYLLFYPDRNEDDVPDGPPEVHLEGFGIEDTHSVANSLRWGPDGWLYGAQGSTVGGNVRRPGSTEPPVVSMGQNIWRYHPGIRRFEIFAEGGGNAQGLEIDSMGRIFSGYNGGDTRGFHYVQGGYYRKGFEKHGPLSNPYTFGFLEPMRHHRVERFTHALVIYEDNALPPAYRGKLFGVEPLQGRIVLSEVLPDGSTLRTRDVGHPVTSADPWFRPVEITVGPDGAVYIADFYDGEISHREHFMGRIDRTNGRVYRLKAKGAAPVPPRDLGRMHRTELIDVLSVGNRWERQTALRLLVDRKGPDTGIDLRIARNNARTSLQTLNINWALSVCEGADAGLIGYADPHVRLWNVRLLCEEGADPQMLRRLAAVAQDEPDALVRSQLASSARRLPASLGLPIVRRLLNYADDVADPHLPLLLWWAIEAKVGTDPDAVLALFDETPVWDLPLVKEHILERIMRRFAATGRRADLLACARLLRRSPGPDHAARLMKGFEEAFKGRSLAGLPDELIEALGSRGSTLLGVRRGLPEAVAEALRLTADPAADRALRLQLVAVFGEVRQPSCVPVLLALLKDDPDDAIRRAALASLQRYDDPTVGAEVVQRYGGLSEDSRAVALTLLASRPAWTAALLDAIDAGRIDPRTVPIDVVRKLSLHRERGIQERVAKRWGALPGLNTLEANRQIERLLGVLRAGRGDPYRGKPIFTARCAKCHTLFDSGGAIGPNLTSYQRDDLEALLLAVVNPSAEIREGYETVRALAKDGRRVDGFVLERDPNVLILRGADGQNVTLAADEIESTQLAPLSLMPEGLLGGLGDQEIVDLFAYLRTAQPLNE